MFEAGVPFSAAWRLILQRSAELLIFDCEVSRWQDVSSSISSGMDLSELIVESCRLPTSKLSVLLICKGVLLKFISPLSYTVATY